MGQCGHRRDVAPLEMGWGGSKLLPPLSTNNAAWKAVLALAVAPESLICSQRMPDQPLRSISTHRQGAAPVVPGLSLCPRNRTVPWATSSPLLSSPLLWVPARSLLFCVAGDALAGGALAREQQGFTAA